MITKNLAKSLEELNFTYSENKDPAKIHVYGIYGGYLVTVYEIANKKVAYFNFRFNDSEENALKRYDMSEVFSSELDEYSVTDYALSEDGMRVFCSGSTSVFLKLIDRCVSLLQENDIRGVGYCSKCGNKFGSRSPKKVTEKNENHLMCEHCALERLEEINNEAENAVSVPKGNTALGVLGSVMFSMIGVALYFVLYYWLSPAISKSGLNEVRYIFCAAGFIVSLLSYLGYRVFCKKSGLAAYITIPVTSLLFTAIGQYLGVVFEFVANNGFTTSVLSNKHFWLVHLRNTIPTDLMDQFVDNSAIFYKLLMISLMFAAIGAAIFLLSFHDKSVVKKETAEIETIKIEQ